MPIVHGIKIDPPENIHDPDPITCCRKVMAHVGSRDGYQVYECGGCTTVLAFRPGGEIYLIHEGRPVPPPRI